MFFSFSQKYPLPELEDSYVERARNHTKANSNTYGDENWEDVKKKIEYSWGSELIDLCYQRMEGDASRRRFVHIFKNFDGLKGISINIRKNYVNVYIFGKPENGAAFFQNKFRGEIEVYEWKNGWSFNVQTKNQYEDLLKWLPLKKVDKKVA